MPEKIRAAVTSKEITPEEHSRQSIGVIKNGQEMASDTSFTGSCQSEPATLCLVSEELDEELLQSIVPEKDFNLFKHAWTKSKVANEEVCMFI